MQKGGGQQFRREKRKRAMIWGDVAAAIQYRWIMFFPKGGTALGKIKLKERCHGGEEKEQEGH